MPDRPGRRLGDGELRRASGGGDGVLRLVHLRLHGLPRRQPAGQPQGAGGVPGVPLLLRHRVDDPDVLAVTVEEKLKGAFVERTKVREVFVE